MLTPRFRGMRRGVFGVLIVAVLFLSGVASANPIDRPERDVDGPRAGPVPELSISLTPSQLQAEVTQSQLGAVTFGGEVTVDQMRMMSSTVTLTAVVNTGWPVVLSPQTIEMNGPGTEEFQVTVIVPPATSALLAGNVIVTGQCKAPGLAPVVAAASAVVTIAPYYLAHITTTGSEVTVDAGETRSVILTVTNDGNSGAQMHIYVADKPKEIRVSFSETDFHLQSDEATCITVAITAIGGANAGDYVLFLKVDAETREGSTEQVAALDMSVYIPSIKAKLGNTGMMAIVIAVVVVVGVAIFWKMGKLKMPKGLKFPRRSKSESKGT